MDNKASSQSTGWIDEIRKFMKDTRSESDLNK